MRARARCAPPIIHREAARPGGTPRPVRRYGGQAAPGAVGDPLALQPLRQGVGGQPVEVAAQDDGAARRERRVQPSRHALPGVPGQPRQQPRPVLQPQPHGVLTRPRHQFRAAQLRARTGHGQRGEPPGRPGRTGRTGRPGRGLPRRSRRTRRAAPAGSADPAGPGTAPGGSRSRTAPRRAGPARHHVVGRRRIAVQVGDHTRGRAGEQPHAVSPVRGQQQRHPLAGLGGQSVLEQVRRLGHPVGEGGHGQFDALTGGVVVIGDEGRAGSAASADRSRSAGVRSLAFIRARVRPRSARARAERVTRYSVRTDGPSGNG